MTLSDDLKKIFESMAKKNQTSLSQTIVKFATVGLQQSEDDDLGVLADVLDKKIQKSESHESFWRDLNV